MTIRSSRAEGRVSVSRKVSSSLASTAQHRQPLPRETVEPTCPATVMASISMAPKSLTITPIRVPARLRRRWFRSVVLPDPRKPARTTTGICWVRGGVNGGLPRMGGQGAGTGCGGGVPM
ncbi:hypothetical protein SCYAM73S_05697 [Streptomyces cyaneofuscatus]